MRIIKFISRANRMYIRARCCFWQVKTQVQKSARTAGRTNGEICATMYVCTYHRTKDISYRDAKEAARFSTVGDVDAVICSLSGS